MTSFTRILPLSLLIALAGTACRTDSPRDAYLWPMDSEEELVDYGNDQTGARFELSSDVSRLGSHSVKVIPSGSAPETKLALPLEGKRLSQWLGHEKASIQVYIPEGNRVPPENFFLGMADVTDNWEWVDGVYWDELELSPGWNRISYTLPEAMTGLNPDGQYTMFFFFIAYMPPREDNIALPMHESFYIDGISMLQPV